MHIFNLNFRQIYLVIPLYNHCEGRISSFIHEITSAGFSLILVNNNSQPVDIGEAKTLNNGLNLGIAKALNQGIEFALNNNADQILLFDQDSFLTSDELITLSNTASKLFAGNSKIAAAGPMFFEGNTKKFHGFAQYGILKINKKVSGNIPQPCLFLITSGTILSPKCLSHVGLMDESLFIDYVDVEWCLRAASLGYQIYGMPNVIMKHEVGYFKKQFLWYKIPYHSQFRLYFQTRNSLLMYMRGYIPLRWKICDVIYFVKRTLFYICIDIASIKTIFRAVLDAITFKK
jgi:rhamnosyltransferase